MTSINDNTYDYSFFVKRSTELNRYDYSLSSEEQKKFNSIKFKLGIKDVNSFKRVNQNKSGITKQKEELSEMYKVLNKITTKTYDKLSGSIIEYFKNIDDKELQKELCEKLFSIISSNGFYSELYAKLYHDMLEIHETFKDIFMKKIDSYIEGFKTLEYVSPNKDYDLYCNYVKQVDSIESVTKFIIHCAKLDICSTSNIMELLFSFQKRMIDNIDDSDSLIENEAYVNNIFIIIKEYSDFLSFHEEWDFVCRNIKYLKEESGDGKNNKIRFKIMDIDDLINK